MSKHEFCFADEGRNALSVILSKTKPRLSDDRIVFFLNTCENNIGRVLSMYPKGLATDRTATAAIKRVADCAYDLGAALRQLDGASLFSLLAALLTRGERGCSFDEIRKYNYELDDLISRIREEAHELNGGASTTRPHVFSLEIATALAKAYAMAFNKVPSLRHDSQYKRFVDEITNNCLPECFCVSIGKNQMALANERAKVCMFY